VAATVETRQAYRISDVEPTGIKSACNMKKCKIMSCIENINTVIQFAKAFLVAMTPFQNGII
jgi:hypothetical protein